jgi:starvation-inducible DNA-binding protein
MKNRLARFSSSNIRFHTKVDIAPDVKEKSIDNFSHLLSLFIDLRQQFRTVHWNVKGLGIFIAVHKQIDELQELIDDYTDEIAEKIVFLGGVANGTVQNVTNTTLLEPFNVNESFSVQRCLNDLDDVLATVNENVCAVGNDMHEYGDEVNSNYCFDLCSRLEHILYLIEAHLQNEK